MDKRFLRAFLTPSRTLLCGYRLFPWCLKHRLWLEALEHPILTGKPCTPAELLFFAKVCAEKDPSRVGLRDRWQSYRLAVPAVFNRELEAAYDHLRLDCWPRFWEKSDKEGGGSRNRGIPWALSILTNLNKSGIGLEDALNLPECQALWLSTSSSVSQGASIDVLTTEDEALLDSLSRVDPPKDEPRHAV